MRYKRSIIAEGSAKVPGYIVTFSDMVTLLLTFFVMLLSLAKTQDMELINKGRDSFIYSLRTFGLGILMNKKERPDFGHVKVKYSINPSEDTFDTRVISAREERTERLFQKLDESMKTLPSQIVADRTVYNVTDIRFSPGDDILSERASEYLTKFCRNLLLEGEAEAAKQLYVLGLAPDAGTEREQWLLSARRAGSVASFLQSAFGSSNKWRIYYWGAGPGGDWVGQGGPISKESQVLIAILQRDDY